MTIQINYIFYLISSYKHVIIFLIFINIYNLNCLMFKLFLVQFLISLSIIKSF
jgi:hypothetical protein